MLRAIPLIILLFAAACTTPATTVTDIDGNVYPAVQIGGQVWMTQNLRVTHYRNGDTIIPVTDFHQWSQTATGACCYYENDTGSLATYGRLYNWYAIADARNIAPKGWHVPSAEELAILVNNLRGDTLAGGYMKAANGFAALPGGYRHGSNGAFHTLGSNGYWWHTTGSYELFRCSNRFYSSFADTRRDTQYYRYGFAVRCVKD